ncbi:MAG: bis(5'-nucleosyl)-tetraphosphatase (symmetrical) YqeK [Anaerolineales bacterium]|nr:bis(5'-nucleosyl)-tetraphosphatase (symmetrical) YqeK [Anaerolineales bacterium]
MYTPELEEQVRQWAEARVPAKRWAHVCGVVEAADQLARRYAPTQVLQARLAGWIHDAAKSLDDETLLQTARAYDWPIIEIERQVPDLLHGAVGYLLANEEFQFDDPQLASACTYHTTGAPNMASLDKVVLLADLIEPTRHYPNVERLRALCQLDLDAALLFSMDFTLAYLIERHRLIDTRAVDCRNQLLAAGVHYES